MAQLTILASQLAASSVSLQSSQVSSKQGYPDIIWLDVERNARALADGLRSRSDVEDTHTSLGNSALPSTLTSLLKASVNVISSSSSSTGPSRVPNGSSASAAYELLRVGANLCMDHDGNRQRLLDTGCLAAILNLLNGYRQHISQSPTRAPLTRRAPHADIKLPDIKIIKTAFGVILNASMDFDPVRSALVSLDAPSTVFLLASAICPPGGWMVKPAGETASDEAIHEEWIWRSGLSSWSWRTLDTFREGEKSREGPPKCDATFVQFLADTLESFVPPYPTEVPSFAEKDPAFRRALINADVEILQEVSMLIESFTMDSEEMRTLLVAPRPETTGSEAVTSQLAHSPFAQVLQFVEYGSPPIYWSSEPENEQKKWEKTFGLCKGAIIKGVVTVAGEDTLTSTLWDDAGWFVQRMRAWVKEYPVATIAARPQDNDEFRDDLVICATLCLGNLARKDTHCLALVRPPISIVPDLIPLLHPSMDIKLKHGVVGLVKNLSQAPASKALLGEALTVEALTDSKIWDRSADMADVVQLSAIGIVKHLSSGHVTNALRLFKKGELAPCAIDQISDLIRRTDSLTLQSEATRVLVNVIKTLWVPPGSGSSTPSSPTSPVDKVELADRKAALAKLTNEETADALAELIGRNLKYHVLLNEGIIALTLLASQPSGVPYVLPALVSPLGPENPTPDQRRAESQTSQSTTTGASASTALEMLVSILADKGPKPFPPELRANACSLLSSVGAGGAGIQDADGTDVLETVKDATRSAVLALANLPAGVSGAESTSASRATQMMRAAAARTLSVLGLST